MADASVLQRFLICASPVLLATLLAACQREALPIAKVSPEPERPRPSVAAAMPAYVGRWAVTPSACRDKAWTLAADQLQSPGPFSCTFDQVSPTSAGYTVMGMCRVGKAAAPGRLLFTMTRLSTGPSLTVSGGPFQEPIGLVGCPEGVQASADADGSQG